MTAGHVRWPADRFYWAVIDASVLPGRSRPTPKRLGFLFEDVLPGLAIEDVHAVYRRLDGSPARYLACGLPREVLETQVPLETLQLLPESLPPFVEDSIDPAEINLLTGSYAPPALRAARTKWLLHAAAALFACTVLVVLGFERRVHASRQHLDDLDGARTGLIEQVLGPQPAGSSALPVYERLKVERRRLEQTRLTGGEITDPPDAALTLAAVLKHWPTDLRAETETLSVGPSSIDVGATVPTMADAQRLAESLGQLPGWTLMPPRSEARRDSVVVGIHLGREGEP